MKLGKVGWSLIGFVTLVLVAGLIWPGASERVWPGSGANFASLRSGLGLPEYNPAPATTGAPSAQRGPAGQGQGRGGGAGAGRPPAPVVLDTAARGSVPVIVEAVGAVQPIATVALKSRVDAQVQEIRVADGAVVQEGDIIAILDSRQIEAQIKQAEASLARNNTTLEQARRDVGRFEELVERASGTKLNLDNARTQAAAAEALIMGDRAQIENLKVQLTYYTIRAPIPGRIGSVGVKAGNIIRAGDNNPTGTLGTIVQTKPIYVAFSIPQRLLPDLRESVKAGESVVEARPQGARTAARGKIAFVDNTIDISTGTVIVRARFDNDDEFLWPGQLCNLRIVLRTEENVVSVPRNATQAGQVGSFVYVIENGVARVQTITVGRTQDGRDIVTEGLKGGESIVVEGALALVNGARVEPRPAAAASKRNS
jgi:multidrug efflux system membrane fusion protein